MEEKLAEHSSSSSSNPYQSPDPNFPNFIVENNDNRRIYELEEYIAQLHKEAIIVDSKLAILILLLLALCSVCSFMLGIGFEINY